MAMNDKMNLINLIGLVLNFAGTFLVAISFGSYPGGVGGHLVDNGRRTPIAYLLHSWLFKIGIGLIILGFAIQIIPASSFLWQK